MTDTEIDNLWLEAFKASTEDGRVRQRFAELCYQKGAAEAELSRPVMWQPIETAPRGSGENGPNNVTHPDYVPSPNLLLKHADGIAVGYYEWYYHLGYGRGASPDEPVWRSRPDYSGLYEVTHWMPLPAPPESA